MPYIRPERTGVENGLPLASSLAGEEKRASSGQVRGQIVLWSRVKTTRTRTEPARRILPEFFNPVTLRFVDGKDIAQFYYFEQLLDRRRDFAERQFAFHGGCNS